ncbi:Hypp8746 [Branchiostoma lanceolatum]|uniref:Hypp8746 protein n=1 Tax=Branchiostoma lanceolatum TaxID=7740 RepID=A0A8J9ZAE9_BRALA|nr:Hypp8746 [Branchiostoma lanceolatum]
MHRAATHKMSYESGLATVCVTAVGAILFLVLCVYLPYCCYRMNRKGREVDDAKGGTGDSDSEVPASIATTL